mgnify:CR=1 FL=1
MSIPSAVGFLLRDVIEVKVYLVGGLLGPALLCVSVRSSVVWSDYLLFCRVICNCFSSSYWIVVIWSWDRLSRQFLNCLRVLISFWNPSFFMSFLNANFKHFLGFGEFTASSMSCLQFCRVPGLPDLNRVFFYFSPFWIVYIVPSVPIVGFHKLCTLNSALLANSLRSLDEITFINFCNGLPSLSVIFISFYFVGVWL